MHMQACHTTILPKSGRCTHSVRGAFLFLCVRPLWAGALCGLATEWIWVIVTVILMASIWLSGSLFYFLGWREWGVAGWERGGVIWLLVPQAAQLSQLLPLSFLLISPPYASASSPALRISVPSIRGCNYYGFVLSGGYREPFRDWSRFRSCFKSDAVGYIRLRQCCILSGSRGFLAASLNPTSPPSLLWSWPELWTQREWHGCLMGHGYSASGDFVGRWVVGWQGACGLIVSHSKLHTTFDELKIVTVSYPCEFSSLWRGGTTKLHCIFLSSLFRASHS